MVEYIIKGLALYPPPCKISSKTKARNTPRNEENVWSKSKTLRGLFY